jgi:predicted permease
MGRAGRARAGGMAIPALLALGWASGGFDDSGAFLRLVEASWLALLGLGLVSFVLAPKPLTRDEQLLLLFTAGGMAETIFLMGGLPYDYITRENLLSYAVTLAVAVTRPGKPSQPREGSAASQSPVA